MLRGVKIDLALPYYESRKWVVLVERNLLTDQHDDQKDTED
jgi:hypothetical protein